MYRNVLYLVWFYNEIQAENKTSEILRVQKKKKKANERTTHLYCFDAKRVTAKEIVRQETTT